MFSSSLPYTCIFTQANTNTRYISKRFAKELRRTHGHYTSYQVWKVFDCHGTVQSSLENCCLTWMLKMLAKKSEASLFQDSLERNGKASQWGHRFQSQRTWHMWKDAGIKSQLPAEVTSQTSLHCRKVTRWGVKNEQYLERWELKHTHIAKENIQAHCSENFHSLLELRGTLQSNHSVTSGSRSYESEGIWTLRFKGKEMCLLPAASGYLLTGRWAENQNSVVSITGWSSLAQVSTFNTRQWSGNCTEIVFGRDSSRWAMLQLCSRAGGCNDVSTGSLFSPATDSFLSGGRGKPKGSRSSLSISWFFAFHFFIACWVPSALHSTLRFN